MTIKGIVFDKDGTLVDFNATWFAIGARLALEAAGGDSALAERLMSEAGYDFSTRRFRADSVFAAGTNADIVEFWFAGRPAEMKRSMIRHFDEVTATEGALQAKPVAGACEALAALHARGYTMAVATNDSTAGAEQTLVTLGVAQMFAAAYGYDAVANPKPAPDVIHAFCDLTGLRPGEIAMVGDNRHDLETAHAAGALAVGVLSGTGTRESLEPRADHILGSIADLPEFLRER